MTDVTRAIDRIEAATREVGLPALAQRAGVPYSTVAELRQRGWRNRSVEIFEKLTEAANACLPPEEGHAA